MARNNIATLTTIQYFRGNTNRCQFTRTVNGSPIDITGFAYALTVSRLLSPLASEAAANQIMQLTGTIDDGPNGLFSFAPTGTDYDLLNEADGGDYTESGAGILVANLFYDIRETNGSSAIETLGKGVFQVLMDISK